MFKMISSDTRPIEKIEKALDKLVYIKLKGRRAFKAVLKSFDEHLNLFLEETVEINKRYNRETNKHDTIETELDSIILRGDNVVFVTLEDQAGNAV